MTLKYIVDYDLHIHSYLSICSGEPKQTASAILNYAVENGLKNICITDHCWGSTQPVKMDFYNGNYIAKQDISRVSQILPLPQAEGVNFHFGCETDIDDELNIGVTKEDYDVFEFIIIPTTHLHMFPFESVEKSAEAYVKRYEKIFDADFPFDRTGIAHLTTKLIAPEDNWKHVLNLIPDSEFYKLFKQTAKVGMGVELNAGDLAYYNDEEMAVSMRVFNIAKECGCKFYFGSDAHNPNGFGRVPTFHKLVDLLDLQEEDKFNPFTD